MKNFDTACKMANKLCKDWTFDGLCKLMDFCTENEIEFFHDEEEGRIYIEDDWFQIEE